MTFRLLTYNILNGGVGRTESLARVINACAPDFVLLQEATNGANVERLAAATGMADFRTFQKQSLGFMSRLPVAFCQWIRPRICRHAFIEVVPAGERVRIFGVHLSAVHAAWTEQRRPMRQSAGGVDWEHPRCRLGASARRPSWERSSINGSSMTWC